MPSTMEIIGFLTGILGVYLTIKRSPFCWPISSINVLLYCFLFYEEQLYADAGLQLVFFSFSIYGWILWTTNAKSYKPDDSPLQITKSGQLEMLIAACCLIPLACTLGYGLDQFTDAALPYFDSFLAIMSIWGQYLQTKKHIEHWYIWIIVDALYIVLYIQKDLILTAVLYGVFLVMAIQGAIIWKSALRSPTKNLA